MEKKHKLVDLFAGCGGLTEGFEKTGRYETVACVEWEKDAATTLANRLKTKWGYTDSDERVLRFDIQRTEELLHGWNNDTEYGKHLGLESLVQGPAGIDLIIGGPPCQAYSIAGRIRDDDGMRYDYRNFLFESYLRVVKHLKPKLVVFENVPGMLSASPGGVPVVDRIIEGFDEAGYELIKDIRGRALIDFAPFGVPQKRRRVILTALNRSFFKNDVQHRIVEFYQEFLPRFHVRHKATVFDAIGDLPKLYPSEEDFTVNGKKLSHRPAATSIPNHVPRYHNRRDIGIFRDLTTDLHSGQNEYASIERLKRLYEERTGKTSEIHKYYVLRWNCQSNLIPAHLYKDGLRHIHPDPEQARSITVREAARLQTFDDDFVFMGSMGNQYKMVGNAVPPLFAKALANALFEFQEAYRTRFEGLKCQNTCYMPENSMIKN